MLLRFLRRTCPALLTALLCERCHGAMSLGFGDLPRRTCLELLEQVGYMPALFVSVVSLFVTAVALNYQASGDPCFLNRFGIRLAMGFARPLFLLRTFAFFTYG